MTGKKKKFLITTAVVVIVTVVGVALFIVYPPAGVAIGVFAAAAITWCVTKAFDTIAEHVAETLPLTNHVLDASVPHDSHIHTHTLIMSRDTTDEQGRHVTETITDIVQDDDEPRPSKHKLAN